jgi:hypothetical protein
MVRARDNLYLLCLLFLVTSCARPLDLKQDSQHEFDTNPKLKARGIVVTVLEVKNGYLKANIDKGFSSRTRKAINDGKSLKEIYLFTDDSVSVLNEAEEILKRKPEIKSVMWTAAAPEEVAVPR